MIIDSKHICLFILLCTLVTPSCKTSKNYSQSGTSIQGTAYPIDAVDINHVKLTDNLWLPIIRKVQEKTIAYALKKCIEEGRLDNFLIAGGMLKGETKGAMPFDDTDIYKIIEGASNTLISAPNPKLDKQLDSLINIIAVGQEKDGYLTTWRTINPAKPPAPWVPVKLGKRWESLSASHELYNSGHMYEAAYTHYIATGKRNFLDIALKNANLLVKTFGDNPDQIKGVPGHQIVETGLIKLFRATNDVRYKNLARYFLDNRGNASHHELYGEYSQDHIPVTQQNEAVGHAVRAVYMYAAMTDIAVMDNDSNYDSAVHALWQNMVDKKLYITGGIGAKHEGEAFGENYELPNLTSYNETCAAIGSVYWSHRLHCQSGDAKYFNLIEKTLYNGLISGLSDDGVNFFYPNALEADGIYKFNRGACTRQGWFDCSCCPTNIIRFLPALPGLVYSQSQNEIYVNLYVANAAHFKHKSTDFTIQQSTNYPWDGTIKLNISTDKPTSTTMKLRIPSWAKTQSSLSKLYRYTNDKNAFISTCRVNGENVPFDQNQDYISILRTWDKNDIVELDFAMPTRLVQCDEIVSENRGKVAIERGPFIYAIEEIDNKQNFDNAYINESDIFVTQYEKELLGGIVTLKNNKFKAIPYYAWSNRGIGKMKVWINYKEQ